MSGALRKRAIPLEKQLLPSPDCAVLHRYGETWDRGNPPPDEVSTELNPSVEVLSSDAIYP